MARKLTIKRLRERISFSNGYDLAIAIKRKDWFWIGYLQAGRQTLIKEKIMDQDYYVLGFLRGRK